MATTFGYVNDGAGCLLPLDSLVIAWRVIIAHQMRNDNEAVRRHLAAINNLTDEQLWYAYKNGFWDPNLDRHDPVVKAVIETRLFQRFEAATTDLQHINEESKEQVKRLADSSDMMETLTRKLKNLTWALIVLTIAAVVVPIGIEVWKAHYAAPTSQTTPVLEPRKPSP